jgi:ribonucleoside-diphosphate reductase beta chain
VSGSQDSVPEGSPDIRVLSEDDCHPDREVGALDLYSRWERQNWRIADLDMRGDSRAWQDLAGYARDGLETALSGFFVGEVAVVETLAPLAHHAPKKDFQFYICTQLADEARHVLFFQSYLNTVNPCGRYAPSDLHQPDRRSESLANLVERELEAAVKRVQCCPDDIDSWYAAVGLYHLLVEGVLAITVLRSIRSTVQRLKSLPALLTGIENVTRDESRHITFGVIALRDGIRTGRESAIRDVMTANVAHSARALVDPERLDPTPFVRPLLRRRGHQLREQWESASRALTTRMNSIGLHSAVREVESIWGEGCMSAVAEYERLHQRQHPIRFCG